MDFCWKTMADTRKETQGKKHSYAGRKPSIGPRLVLIVSKVQNRMVSHALKLQQAPRA